MRGQPGPICGRDLLREQGSDLISWFRLNVSVVREASPMKTASHAWLDKGLSGSEETGRLDGARQPPGFNHL